MKRCGTRGASKPLAQFNRKRSRADDHQEACRLCNRESSRRYYQQNRDHHIKVIRARTKARQAVSISFVAEYLSANPCVDCGESDLRVLDFDHRPGSAKRGEVMRLVRNGHSLAVVATEMGKCDVRCRNCYAIVTYDRLGPNWRSAAMTHDHAPRSEPEPEATGD